MIEEIKKEIENIQIKEYTTIYGFKNIILEILDKYNNQQEFKWKCDICGEGFNNFHAQGFDNKIYCPLCYFKHEFTNYKNAWEELLLLIDGGNGYEIAMELKQKYNLGGEQSMYKKISADEMTNMGFSWNDVYDEYEKVCEQLSQLQQEKEELIKWLEEELAKYKIYKEVE